MTTWQVTIEPTNVFFFILIKEEESEAAHSHMDRQQCMPQSCPGATSVLLCTVIILSEEPSVQMNVLEITTLAHYIDEVMLLVIGE